ncbi:MAG TPA: SBBP repeat-containing protein [Ignavibacteria bacterium]|nr:SBBP repeat-containing protein [Ignavibacteria bacterium]
MSKKIINIVFIAFIVVFISKNNVFSQYAPEEEWAARFNGATSGNDFCYDIEADASGNIYATGFAFMNSGRKIVTIKYNPLGTIEWISEYGPAPINETTEQVRITVDISGNIIVTAPSAGTGDDIVVLKYNNNGNLLWDKRFSGPGSFFDEPRAITTDVNGNIYICGRNWMGSNGDDFITLKYSAGGELIWSKTYNGTGNNNDQANSIAVDNSGNVFVTGQSFGVGTNRDYLTIKYNSNGDTLWTKRYSGTSNRDDIPTVIKILNGDPIITGYSYNIMTRNDFTTIRYNSETGNQTWIAKYNGPTDSTERAFSMHIDNSGNIFVAGDGFKSTPNNLDMLVVKYNSSGVQQWFTYYNHPTLWIDRAFSVKTDDFGKVYLGGYSWITNREYDYNIVCLEPDGKFFWNITYNGPFFKTDLLYDMVIVNNRFIYAGGYSRGISSNNDYAVVKFSQQVNVNNISTKIPNNINLYQNYPNPFNPVTKIKFDIPTQSKVSLKLYDTGGREIKNLLDLELSAGEFEYTLNASDLNSGIYFYVLYSGDYRITKKLVLLK